MSIRPVKQIITSKPTIEGAGVKLRRAFGFGETGEFDPFLLLDDFRNDRPDDYLAGFPWHPHRGIETITYVLAGNGRARRQPRQSRHSRRRRRAVDDRRQRHHAPGNAAGRRAGPHARLPALGQSAVVAEDDGAALSGRQGGADSGSRRRRRHARARGLRRFLGQARPGRRRRRRSALSRRLGAAGQAQDAAGRDRAPRLRLCVRGLRHFPRRVAAVRRADREDRRRRARPWSASRPATARWCCSTAATRSPCRPATRASASCWSPASRSRSRSPGTARS